VRDGIDAVEDLAGTTLATPALGNTQDVALRAWLADEGYETDQAGAAMCRSPPGKPRSRSRRTMRSR
jgi:ABC-type nitrate/sulfonate/bicarbonate transport system substrate-binding protein